MCTWNFPQILSTSTNACTERKAHKLYLHSFSLHAELIIVQTLKIRFRKFHFPSIVQHQQSLFALELCVLRENGKRGRWRWKRECQKNLSAGSQKNNYFTKIFLPYLFNVEKHENGKIKQSERQKMKTVLNWTGFWF